MKVAWLLTHKRLLDFEVPLILSFGCELLFLRSLQRIIRTFPTIISNMILHYRLMKMI